MKNSSFLFLLFMLCIPLQIVFSQSENNPLIDSINVTYELAQKNLYKNPTLAATNYEKMIALVDRLPKDTKDVKIYLSKQANAYRVLGGYAAMDHKTVKALELQEKSLAIKRRIGERETQIQNYQAMGAYWGNEGDFEKAGIAIDSAYAIAVETKSKRFLSEAARGKATYFRAIEVNDSAAYYFKIAIKTADLAEGKVPKYAALDMYGRFLREQNKIAESLIYVDQFLEALQSNKDTVFFPQVYLTKAESQLALGNPEKAIENYKKGIYYVNKTNQREDLIEFYRGLTQSYEAAGLYKKAVATNKLYVEAYQKKRDTLAYRERAEVALKNKYALQKAVDSTAFAQQKLLDESELKRKANTRFWIVVTLLLAILSCIAFFFIRNRQKIKEQAYQNILLNNKVATKTEEINELLTETIQHIKSKERIAENLQKLAEKDSDMSLKSIIADLKAGKSDDSKLLLVKENIEKVNFEFIKKLHSDFPELTKTDIEICSFLRIGLDRNQIAQLRNTSIEAVRKSRHRIRKKMQLEDHVDLEKYLSDL
ncbi:MAG: hypothetical protein AAF611_06590 [Bacteroidota bacterium]